MPTPDDALMWLNDHSGELVAATLDVVKGTYTISPMEANGTLKHWRQMPRPEVAAAVDPEKRREDIRGRYFVDEMALDLTDLPDAAKIDITPWQLSVSFAADLSLTVLLAERI